jgi:hypothetical protein
MAFDTLGRPTNKAVDNVNVFKFRPGQIVDNDVYLDPGDYINPGQDANGNPGIAKQYQGETTSSPKPNDSGRTISEGTTIAKALYNFLPDEVIDEFAKAWVKSGDSDVAIGTTRQTKAWKDNFGKLMRDDGTLVMDEMTFLSTKASYKQTLAEVGIKDFTDFEDEFDDMATGFETDDPVSAEEFQARIDMVYGGVKDQIPEVEKLFRERFNINLDAPTIFGALINPKIQDKVLAGEIATLQLQAEASSRGFTTTFGRFQELRNLGFTQEQAKGVYSTASDFISQASSVGRDLDISTLEDAALGDTSAQQRLQRIQSEVQSRGGLTLGAAKKGDEVIGLTAD